MKKFLLVFLFATGGSLFLTQLDDELSKEATDLLARVDTSGTSEAYLHLSGIFAAPDENPIDVGKYVLREMRRLEADHAYEPDGYEKARKIPLPKGALFCRAWEEGCIATLFSSGSDVDQLLTEYEVLVQRADTFLEFREFSTLTRPIPGEASPPYQYLAAAERIRLLKAVATYRNGDPDKAIEDLFQQFSALRKSLELQDNLIGKLVFLAKLSEVIDVASVILSQEGIKAESIPRLSSSERSFDTVVAREFATAYYMFKRMDKHPEFFELGGDLPGWITRIVFKPAMTANAVVPVYYRAEHLAQLSPAGFASEIEGPDPASLTTSSLRNYVGGALIRLSLPDFDPYIARLMDLDVKLALFNQVHASGRAPESMENPYYGREAPVRVNGSICFDGPLEDKRHMRCLKVRI